MLRMITLSILAGGVFSVFAMGMADLRVFGWPAAIALMFGALICYQFQIISIRGQLRIYLEQAARRQKLPLCLNCGYNVAGLQSDRCPECGAIWDHRAQGDRQTG